MTSDEKSELEALNTAVQAALDSRREWLDIKMHETSKLQVGDDIYDIDSGVNLGVVTGLYRYHAGRNDLYDTSVHCDYEYRTLGGCNDNTSRQTSRFFGTREEAAQRAQFRADQLSRRVG